MIQFPPTQSPPPPAAPAGPPGRPLPGDGPSGGRLLGERALFDATLTPNTSLSSHGSVLVLALLGGALLVPSVVFLALGLWPITGFCVAEFLLVVTLFRLHRRRARRFERVVLTRHDLLVLRQDHRGERHTQRLEPAWARVDIDDPVEHDSQIRLISRGTQAIVGAFLSPPERLDFARALREALVDWRLAGPT